MYRFGNLCFDEFEVFAERAEGNCYNHSNQNENLQAFTYFSLYARGRYARFLACMQWAKYTLNRVFLKFSWLPLYNTIDLKKMSSSKFEGNWRLVTVSGSFAEQEFIH